MYKLIISVYDVIAALAAGDYCTTRKCALLSLSQFVLPSFRGHLVKMFINLESHCIF